MIMAVYCDLDGCEENAGGYSVEVPNPDSGWCKECRQQIGPILLTHYFCSPEHALEWLQEYIRSSNQKVNLVE